LVLTKVQMKGGAGREAEQGSTALRTPNSPLNLGRAAYGVILRVLRAKF
jgi:hypothetical protein